MKGCCILLAVVLVSVIKAEFPKSEIVPCAGWENVTNSLLKIDQVRVSPEPAVLPGTLKIQLKGSLSRDVPNLFVKADIYKIFFDGRTKTHVPCIEGFGSCVYDICEMTKNAYCPPELSTRGLPCKCPFHKFTPRELVETVTVDHIPSLIDWVKNGDYDARAEIMESADGAPIACFNIKAYIRSAPELDCTDPILKFTPKCFNIDDIIG